MANGELTVSVAECARLLGLSKNSTLDAVHRGEIPHVRIGRRVLVPRRALEEMLESVSKGNNGHRDKITGV